MDFHFSVHFFDKFSNEGYESVQTWIKGTRNKRQKTCSLSVIKRIFIPVNKGGNHWFLAVIHVEERKLIVYDSISIDHWETSFHHAAARKISDWFKMESNCPDAVLAFENYANCPKQDNGYDCGLFLLANIILLKQNLPLEYRQDTISKFRSKVLHDILECSTQITHIDDLNEESKNDDDDDVELLSGLQTILLLNSLAIFPFQFD